MAMRWQRISGSTMMNRAGYDFESETMEIEFSSGQVYTFNEVPVSVFNGLLEATSPGQYYHRNIKGSYG